MLLQTSPDSLFPFVAVTTFVSSSEKLTASTCCVQLLRLTVMTSSALLYLTGHQLHTADLSTSASALMTRMYCSNRLALCAWLTKRSLA